MPQYIREEIIGEVDDGVVEKTVYLHGSELRYEEGEKTVWILSVFTPIEERNQGQAKALIQHLILKNKKIVWGEFLEDGKKFLQRYAK